MANLVKINQVHFLMGFETPEGAADCVVTKRLLDSNQIPYVHLHYGDSSQHAEIFSAHHTWSYGSDFRTEAFNDFPIVFWTEYYDDYERFIEVVKNSTDLANSNLIKHKDKIVPRPA